MITKEDLNSCYNHLFFVLQVWTWEWTNQLVNIKEFDSSSNNNVLKQETYVLVISLVSVCVGGKGGGWREGRGIAGTLEPIIRLCSEYSRFFLPLSKFSDRVGIFCALSRIE